MRDDGVRNWGGPAGGHMAHRLLVIEEASVSRESSIQRFLTPDLGFRCDNAFWESFRPEGLHSCVAELILAVAPAETPKVLDTLDWLCKHPIHAPTLAVLPGEPSDVLLRAASGAADDFLLAPPREGELRQRLARLLGPPRADVESVCERLVGKIGLAQLVGSDPAFVRAIEQVPLIVRTDAPVLITGETGTGKELFARAVHHLSPRRAFPFIAIDCGALPEHLFENELFGHARGAFTDAYRDQKGLVALSEGGTLFLDEIDALPILTQAKLLRFLEERAYRPLGSDRFVHANVNIIAATNRVLETCVRDNQFRADLYFRLNVLRLRLPPLRERPGDIVPLAMHFLDRFRRPDDPARKVYSPAALCKLAHYDWPGNVRELYNLVQRAAVLAQGAYITPDCIDVPEPPSAEPAAESFREARSRAISAFERCYIQELFEKHNGNVTRAAREAHKERRTFGRLVKKYGIGHSPPGGACRTSHSTAMPRALPWRSSSALMTASSGSTRMPCRSSSRSAKLRCRCLMRRIHYFLPHRYRSR